MMDQEVLQSYDVDVEDGELSASSDEVLYTPLQRPVVPTAPIAAASNATAAVTAVTAGLGSPLTTCHQQLQRALEEDDSPADDDDSISSSSSGESGDACLKKLWTDGTSGGPKRKSKKRVRRTVMVRIQPTDAEAQKRARFKKYNVWTAALEEEITENMRGCDVTRSGGGCADRNVENYDFSLKYRLNGENSLKRRLSNSTDDRELSDSELQPLSKRGRPTSREAYVDGSQRGAVKSRLGHRSRARRDSSVTSGSDSYEPRHILDLEERVGARDADVAREIAYKLYEEKDELLMRIVEVLGTELPIEIYKETQRIEADGGMMVKNGKRRRTPGGVFLFLLKHNERLTPAEQKSIFASEQQSVNKWRKKKKSMSRDRKVEELKKRLSKQEKELPALSTRKDHFLLGSDLSPEQQAANLSNPPPSPVGNEHSPEYKAHAINHVATDANAEKPSTSASALAALAAAAASTSPTAKELVSYEDDDFLDVNCGDMDFF